MEFLERGNIKWTAMMMPEHKALLAKHDRETRKKQRPILDEQELEEYSRIIGEAFVNENEVVVTLFDEFENNTLTGKITKIDQQKSCIKLQSENDYTWIKFGDIVNIT